MKSSRFNIFIGAVIILASFLVIRASITMTTVTYDYGSNKLQVSSNDYLIQGIPESEPGSNAFSHFSFMVEGGDTVKYVLFNVDEFEKWKSGQLSPSWTEASSDFSYWRDGLPEITPTEEMVYLLHNEDSYPKTIRFEFFKSEKKPDHFYMNSGFLSLLFGAGLLIYGSCERLQSSLGPRLSFVVLVSLYLPILVVSYFAVFFYPLFTFFGLTLVPVAGNFLIGFLIREPDEAAKRIIACFFLHAGVALGLLVFYPVYSQALLAWGRYVSLEIPFIQPNADPFPLTAIMIAGYPILHIILGIPISLMGITVRDLLNPRQRLG